MKTAAITLLAALLVVSFNEAFGSLVGRHELRKRDVDCSVLPDLGERDATDSCCSKTIGLAERVHGAPAAQHAPSEDPLDHVAHGPQGDRKERIRCIIQEKLQNASLLTEDRKLNQGALVSRIVELMPNATAWTHDKIQEIVSSCIASAEEKMVGEVTNCSSGASAWVMCLNRKMLVECPDEYWEHSDQCNSLKGYVIACPDGPPLPALGEDGTAQGPTHGVHTYGIWDKIWGKVKDTVKDLAKDALGKVGGKVVGEILDHVPI
ncbi:uncharacterized protein LOC134540760 [Bacillus rossius redtenbacheri]|uniref:uncharacterized protein LOC134540760 n=1 Tax=Bacillus rossius redtenbacheri TaxID=93214 RepID=UPI002FDCB6B4